MKKFPAILTLSAVLAAAFAVLPTFAADAAAPLRDTPPTVATPDPLPLLSLSEEVMFKYLSAEIAEQRGNYFASYATMMSIARSTRDSRLARRAVEVAMAGKLTNEALSASRLWVELAPHSEEASQVVLGLQLSTNRLDEAKQTLAQRLAASNAQTLPAMIGQTQRLIARVPDKAKAAALLRELLTPYRESLDARLALVQSSVASGDQTTAQREAREALEKNPRSELAVLALSQVVTDKDQSAKLLADFLQKNPKAREVRLAYSRKLFEDGKIAEAKAEFKTLLQYLPQDQTALYALGLLSVQTNDLPEAEKYLAAYIKTLNGKPDGERDATQALMVLAQIAEDRKDLPQALKWLDQVDATGQGAYLGAILKRAQLTAKSGRLDEARKLLAQAEVESDDERIKLIIAEAQLLRDAGQLNEAMQVLEEALQHSPDNTELLYEHAMAAEKNRQTDVMEVSLRKIIKLAPDSPQAYNALGYSLADRNQRLPEAYDLIKKALELAPEDPFIMDSMGWVEFRMGRFEKAEEILGRAYALKPDPEIAAHLGEVLWVKGREDDAKKLWRNASTKDPKNETLKGTLTRLQVKL